MTANKPAKGALVVGATGGMGQAIALALAERHYQLALVGRDEKALADLADRCADLGGTAFTAAIDISDTSSLPDKIEAEIAKLDQLEVMVHCAGTYAGGTADEADLAAWDHALDTNFRAFVHISRTALPAINKSGHGAVICIGSLGYAGPAIQVASKQALAGYCERLFEDVREYGTKVCLIRPGFVNTKFVNSARLDRAKMVQPDDIARTMFYVLDMPQTSCPSEIKLRPQFTPYKKG